MIYIASVTHHADKWRRLRSSGVPVVATWIDLPAAKTSGAVDLTELIWLSRIQEAASAKVLLLYAEQGDNLGRVLIEVGAALASGAKVYVVGPVNSSWTNHPHVRRFATVKEAIDAATTLVKSGPPTSDRLQELERERSRLMAVCEFLDRIDWIHGYEMTDQNMEILSEAITLARSILAESTMPQLKEIKFDA